MANKFMILLTAVGAMGAAMLFAQEGPTKPAEGTLMVQDKNYPLTHALAYETTINEQEVIAVVLSGQAISSEKLKEATKGEKDGQDSDFKRPYLKLEFTKAGELKLWSAGAGNTSLGRRGGNATGELKLQEGRVIGKASQPNETEGMFSSGFDVRFDVALLKAGDRRLCRGFFAGLSRRWLVLLLRLLRLGGLKLFGNLSQRRDKLDLYFPGLAKRIDL
ncbi:MAG: hypothetical protein ABJB22_03425, partial [Verrucomicrobiota bacterium]